ncbi:hypothetical protein B0I35DRAFT_446846 [Stachybotrys elegans]|uniref:Uncharacterized protein n=1 Tax=Stachybotrys elegans TaxID=80388 RepID=A0A8K0WKH4_9HYPO|nr:hypothetical protein B0I35DRAFT_446846 [Stachybotrys elegans]
MSAPRSPADHKSFRFAIVCALSREADAVTLIFDYRADGDTNTYITGRICVIQSRERTL